ncbi:hypothetical protein [Enterococcus sp. AZ196]|uniref:hypothetical protein n=1 Tax=Enterococcus sp. AZ196 TaxID=2774659 RepID=UPI003D2A5C6F
MYKKLNATYRKYWILAMGAYLLTCLIASFLSIWLKYDFSPSKRDLKYLFSNNSLYIILVILFLCKMKPAFFNGAIREFLKDTNTDINELRISMDSQKKIYKIKNGKIYVKRKY